MLHNLPGTTLYYIINTSIIRKCSASPRLFLVGETSVSCQSGCSWRFPTRALLRHTCHILLSYIIIYCHIQYYHILSSLLALSPWPCLQDKTRRTIQQDETRQDNKRLPGNDFLIARQTMDQPGKVANPAPRGQLNRENEYFPVRVVRA